MEYSTVLDGVHHLITINEHSEENTWQVRLDDMPLTVNVAQVTAGHLSLLIGEQSYDVWVQSLAADSADTQTFDVMLDGVPRIVDIVDERRRALAGLAKAPLHSGEVTIKAPMPGLVAQVLVVPGDMVVRNQRVVVLEAMKMQNDLTAPRAGVVRAVKTTSGQAVNQGQPLIVIGEPEGEDNANNDKPQPHMA